MRKRGKWGKRGCRDWAAAAAADELWSWTRLNFNSGQLDRARGQARERERERKTEERRRGRWNERVASRKKIYRLTSLVGSSSHGCLYGSSLSAPEHWTRVCIYVRVCVSVCVWGSVNITCQWAIINAGQTPITMRQLTAWSACVCPASRRLRPRLHLRIRLQLNPIES